MLPVHFAEHFGQFAEGLLHSSQETRKERGKKLAPLLFCVQLKVITIRLWHFCDQHYDWIMLDLALLC